MARSGTDWNRRLQDEVDHKKTGQRGIKLNILIFRCNWSLTPMACKIMDVFFSISPILTGLLNRVKPAGL
jgi:hypothetical protein